MTCKPRVTCVFNTEKVDLFQANKAQEGAKAATGRTVNDVFFLPAAAWATSADF